MKMIRKVVPISVRPELVEGLFSSLPLKKGQGFDKLSPDGMEEYG
jgi:hypothetical protein